jgi:hypothetical protein
MTARASDLGAATEPISGRDLHRAYMFAAVAERYGFRIARELQRRHDAVERAYRAALGIAGVQDVRVYLDTDRVTVLECARGCRATKKIMPDGSIRDYAAGTWFATVSVEVRGIGGFAGLMSQLEPEPRRLIIRGTLIKGKPAGRVRRKITADPDDPDAPYFKKYARKWLGLDFDSFDLPGGVDPVDLDAVAALAVARLPEPFQRATCWGQLTSGAGVKSGGRIRLFYWLSERVDERFLKRWLKGVPGLDHALFCPNTPHYVAAPVIAPGAVDPVPIRSKLIPGAVDVVAVPELPEPARPSRSTSRSALFGIDPPGGRPGAYMVACLRALIDAPPGQGRSTCTNVAVCLYGLCKAGLLDPVDVTARIKGAMIDRGWADDEASRGMTLADVNRQLEWAWQHAEARGLDR